LNETEEKMALPAETRFFKIFAKTEKQSLLSSLMFFCVHTEDRTSSWLV
jgi:hypothetical protein